MNKKIKNILLIILFIMIIGIGIGYAALAQVLTINGTANITANWDIKITSITEGTLKGATSKNAAIVAGDKLSASFDVNLQYPGAEATYIVNVQNAGTINATLESITGIDTANNIEPTDIQFSIDTKEGDNLTAGQSKTYTVNVKWLDSNQVPQTKLKTATITLNYVQSI